MEKSTQPTVVLSEFYRIEVPEGDFSRPEIGENANWPSKNKAGLIDFLLKLYQRDGNFDKLKFNGNGDSQKDSEKRVWLTNVFQKAADAAIENRLRNTIFTFWRKGNALSVLQPIEGADIGNVIVKFATHSNIDFAKDIAPGYKLAMSALGSFSVRMFMAKNLCVRVRDAHMIPRVVLLKNVLIQERVIVLGDLLDSLYQKKVILGREKRYGNFAKNSSRPEQIDGEIAIINNEIKRMGDIFLNLLEKFKEKGLVDDDGFLIVKREGNAAGKIILRKGYERNYGIRIPPDINLAKLYHNSELNAVALAEAYLEKIKKGIVFNQVVGFDFDKLVPIKETEIKTDRVPSVFAKRIFETQKETLEKIIQQI